MFSSVKVIIFQALLRPWDQRSSPMPACCPVALLKDKKDFLVWKLSKKYQLFISCAEDTAESESAVLRTEQWQTQQCQWNCWARLSERNRRICWCFENTLGCRSGAQGELYNGKTKIEISCYCPFILKVSFTSSINIYCNITATCGEHPFLIGSCIWSM